MTASSLARPDLLLFDVNQTMLDMSPVHAAIRAVLPDADSPKLWFATTLQYAASMTLAGRYAPLPEIGAAVLRMLAQGQGIDISPSAAEAAMRSLTRLPAHADVRPALQRLKSAGLRLAALSISTRTGLRAQLDHAGIADCFDAQFSVQEFGLYKPHPDVYRRVAARMRVEAAGTMLVAAHGWDVGGAAWAGLRTAFVERAGQAPFALAPAPELVVGDLGELAQRLGA